MSQLNFLSWRQTSREQLKKHYLQTLSASAVLSVMFIFIWTSVASGRLQSQGERNTYLEENVAEMDQKISQIKALKNSKKKIISRMKAIQDLQYKRTEIVKVFDELVRAIPDGVSLSGLNRVAEVVQLSGFAETNNGISALMRNLDNSYKYEQSSLKKIQQAQNSNVPGSRFDLQITIEVTAHTDITE